MYKNPAYLTLLALIMLVALLYTGKSMYALFHYKKLSSQTETESISWSVEKISEDKYFPKADYKYVVSGKNYGGTTVLRDFIYKNQWAVEHSIPEYNSKRWTVWYSHSDPKYSSLEKDYPYKEWVYTIVIWTLVIYFFLIGNIAAKKQ